ncbi:unnamed protein product, partial [Symbiodinium sp. KB8]
MLPSYGRRNFLTEKQGGRTLPGKEDLIGMRWEEDGHLDEMFGLEDCCPPDPAGKDMVLIQRDEIPKDGNAAGQTGGSVLPVACARQTLTVGEVEVWEDAVLSRTAAVATMSVAKKGESNGPDRILDDADNTATISQAGTNPWLQVELVD